MQKAGFLTTRLIFSRYVTPKSVIDLAHKSKLVILIQSRKLGIKLLFSTANAELSRSLSFSVLTLSMTYLGTFQFGQNLLCYSIASYDSVCMVRYILRFAKEAGDDLYKQSRLFSDPEELMLHNM